MRTDLAWHELVILHRHFRPSQSRKWITAKWLTHGKQLKELAVWGKLENHPPHNPFQYIFEFRSKPSFDYYGHLHKSLLAQQINRDKILFSHTRRWYQFLFLNFFFCYFTLLLIFTKIILFLIFFFIKIVFIFSCSGMFRGVTECSGMFRNVPCSGFYRFISLLNEKGARFCLSSKIYHVSSLINKVSRTNWFNKQKDKLFCLICLFQKYSDGPETIWLLFIYVGEMLRSLTWNTDLYVLLQTV